MKKKKWHKKTDFILFKISLLLYIKTFSSFFGFKDFMHEFSSRAILLFLNVFRLNRQSISKTFAIKEKKKSSLQKIFDSQNAGSFRRFLFNDGNKKLFPFHYYCYNGNFFLRSNRQACSLKKSVVVLIIWTKKKNDTWSTGRIKLSLRLHFLICSHGSYPFHGGWPHPLILFIPITRMYFIFYSFFCSNLVFNDYGYKRYNLSLYTLLFFLLFCFVFFIYLYLYSFYKY